ncbi:hypothetical protein EG68_07469 [Paragonimus skrjabini miyazakii]|uniref:Uncharacterized protein n=1 Tax=Paragonimus skrjabini miyazakii TaxID=59628 RepID=A0A8S9YSM1_9TREM|nr:hypothetical protein EG68_07469 [Paragonimus skrjabini miyazakii]
MKSEGNETDATKLMHQSIEGVQACSEPFCCKTNQSDVDRTPQLETSLKEITSSDTGLNKLKTATLIVQCNRPKSGTLAQCGQQKQAPLSSRTFSELMKVHVDHDFRRTFIQKHVSSTQCFYDPTGRYSTTGELVTTLKPDVIETSVDSQLSVNRLEFSTDAIQTSCRIDNFHTQAVCEQPTHGLYDQAGRIRWSADSRWCPIRGRLQLRDRCRSAKSNGKTNTWISFNHRCKNLSKFC